VEPVIVFWALGRELRLLAGLADAVRQRVDLGSAMQKARVWRNRQGLVRSCVSRAPEGTFHRLLKAVGQGDAAAKGQLRADPWQLASDVVLGLAFAGRKAA
jgi:DNA polymerase-3 subunit delta